MGRTYRLTDERTKNESLLLIASVFRLLRMPKSRRLLISREHPYFFQKKIYISVCRSGPWFYENVLFINFGPFLPKPQDFPFDGCSELPRVKGLVYLSNKCAVH